VEEQKEAEEKEEADEEEEKKEVEEEEEETASRTSISSAVLSTSPHSSVCTATRLCGLDDSGKVPEVFCRSPDQL